MFVYISTSTNTPGTIPDFPEMEFFVYFLFQENSIFQQALVSDSKYTHK